MPTGIWVRTAEWPTRHQKSPDSLKPEQISNTIQLAHELCSTTEDSFGPYDDDPKLVFIKQVAGRGGAYRLGSP